MGLVPIPALGGNQPKPAEEQFRPSEQSLIVQSLMNLYKMATEGDVSPKRKREAQHIYTVLSKHITGK
jgi:hypothetical protein